MEKTDTIFPIAEVIVKKISGELSPGEEDFFNAWINASPRNQDLFNRITDAQNIKERNRLVREIDTAQAWGRYTQEIQYQKKNRYLKIWQYAAILLVPLMVVSLLYISGKQNQTSQNAVQQDQILPGSKNALLVLGNGKSINLQQNDNLSIEEEGTRIVNDNKRLSYHEIKSETSSKIPDNTLIVPRGGEYNLVLSDSSEVYLNSMSKLIFPVTFPGQVREVTLEGEACFMVKKDSGRPFIVNVNGMRIEVMGTTFNVNAYQDQKNVITTLVEGKIRLIAGSDRVKEYILSPDDQAIFSGSPVGNIQIRQVNSADYVQWIKGIYIFDHQSLGDIMQTLSRWYDFNYWFEQEDIERITFKGGLNKYQSIDPILDIIESTGKVDVTVKGKNIVFSKK